MEATPPADSENTGFVRALTLLDATMLVAGSMIGSGIFIVSADIARTVHSPAGLLLSWIVAGFITILGALSYAELAAMYPKAGGQYVFLREAFGPLPAFLFGWTFFTVIQTGTIAAVGMAVGRFLGVLVPALTATRFSWFPQYDLHTSSGVIEFGLSPQRVVALVSVWILTAINLRGVSEARWIQTVLTLIKAASLATLLLLGLTIGRTPTAIAANFSSGNFTAGLEFSSSYGLAFGAALVGSLFACDAWNNVTFAASEVQQPAKNLPRALLFGTLLVLGLYLLTNVAYLCMLPLAGSASGSDVLSRGIANAAQDRVGVAAAQVLFGNAGATVMAAGILLSAFGCNNGLILAGARVFYAMAQDGLFFRSVGVLNRHGAPGRSLVLQAVWTTALCLTGTYGQLLDYVIFAALVFYVLTTAGLFALRRSRPEQERPYRAVGYPYLPALYMVLSALVAVVLLLADKTRTQAMGGLVLVLLGVPVYALTARRESQ